MAYAAVVEVVIDPGADAAHRHGVLSEYVVPEVEALPGFVRALWLNDGSGTGTCIVVFDTEQDAAGGLAVLTRDGGPPTRRAGVHEVEAEA